MADDGLERTRQALHAVAELVLAGPQYRTSGTIKLRVDDDGFATIAAPAVRVVGTSLVCADLRIPMSGETPRSLGAVIGVDVGGPAGLYGDGSGASVDDRLVLDPAAAAEITAAYALGVAAFGSIAPDIEPVLWPEHFDLGIRIEDINYGISPGDAYLTEPYAYVGVDPVPDGEFWNAPFGAARPVRAFAGADELCAFLVEARATWLRRDGGS
jgi:hypothetical protein